MTDTKKIIIFLTPLSNSKNRKLRKELINTFCQQNNLTILKIIEKTDFNYLILRELIEQVVSEPIKAVTVLAEDKLLNHQSSIILFSVVGTLSLLGLVNTEIYKKSYDQIKLYESVKTQNDYLSIAAFSLHYTLECYKNKNNN